MIKRIVLTGGPCAGKTTALSTIEETLTEKGYVVLIVKESATELMNGGIKVNNIGRYNFQKLIMKHQLQKEAIFDEAAKFIPRNKNIVIIYDRGSIDSKAYIGQKKFDKLLNELNLNEINLIDKYDMVIHLVTAADGKKEFYTLENNKERTETIEQAKVLDKKTIDAWAGHNNFKIIDNSTSFDEKINRTIDCINNLLGEKTSLRYQRKYLIDLEKSSFDFNIDNSTKINIIQTYFGDLNYEKRLRKRTLNGETTYFLTVQLPQVNTSKKVITNQKISQKEYEKLYILSDNKYEIDKTRYSFTNNKQYFKLDIFNDIDNFAILEIDTKDEFEEIDIPDNIKVIKEVSNDINYNNYNIAKNKKVKVKKLTF